MSANGDLNQVDIEVKDGTAHLPEPAAVQVTETEIHAVSANYTLRIDLLSNSGVDHKYLSNIQTAAGAPPVAILCRKL